MTERAMLAHLVRRFGVGPENLATEVLAYLLQAPAAAEGMHEHARRFCPDLPLLGGYRTQDWLASDAAIPDLVGVASDGSVPLIVEVKFGAALTANQPVTYLRRLFALEMSSLLLFLVPRQRLPSIWGEIQRRCTEQGMELQVEGSRPIGRYAQVTVAVTSWSDLLDDIGRHLTPTDHRQVLSELHELRGLCDREDRNLFRPFTSEFLGGDIGSRLLELEALLNEAVSVLVEDGKASTTGLTRAAGSGFFGRYFTLAGWTCLLYVSFNSWGRLRPTPLWLRITDRRASGHLQLEDSLATLSAESPSRFLNDDGMRRIPIFLPHDADRDVVFADIDRQLREVEALLATVPPPVAATADSGTAEEP